MSVDSWEDWEGNAHEYNAEEHNMIQDLQPAAWPLQKVVEFWLQFSEGFMSLFRVSQEYQEWHVVFYMLNKYF